MSRREKALTIAAGLAFGLWLIAMVIVSRI